MILTEDNYVSKAENVIKDLASQTDRRGNVNIVTTSQIRNLLAMTADIYNDVVNTQGEKLGQDIISRINYLKIRFVYESGRERKVRDLVDKAEILRCLDEIRNNKKQYILFSRYMEALVAYKRFYVKND